MHTRGSHGGLGRRVKLLGPVNKASSRLSRLPRALKNGHQTDTASCYRRIAQRAVMQQNDFKKKKMAVNNPRRTSLAHILPPKRQD